LSKILLKRKIFTVEEVDTTVRKRKMSADIVVEHNTVAILPITRKGYMLVELQYRPAIGKKIYEIPAGHMEKNEKPVDCARRELEEETGFKAGRLRQINYFYPSPGLLSKKEYFFIAEQLTKGKTSFDKHEDIITKEMSIPTDLKYIKSGKIVDAKTIIAILYYKHFMSSS
jgi:ADP-ribose pyrophosphatase